MTAIRIKATDQLNGVIDRFNGVVQALVPDYTGDDWRLQPTSNPASLFRHVLQGKGNARPLPDDRLALARLAEWHDHCRIAGHEFNAVIDTDLSVREVLQDIAAAGRASPALLDGKWAVIEDKRQTVPVQHFTPANTFGFRGEKAFDDMPHALRVRFINRDKGWVQDERLVFDDGYTQSTATRYDTLDLTGITSAAQAWKAGRYHIATARLRPEAFSLHCDLEHIVCTRGDLIRFSHDVPLVGIGSGRVTATDGGGGYITGVTLDNMVEMEAGKSYALRIRLNDGASLVKPVITAAGQSRTLAFTVPEADTGQLTAGVLAQFGIAERESLALIVKSIEPQSDLTAKITAVDAAPAVHTADSGTISTHDSGMTIPADMQRPPAPVLSQIQSGPEAAVQGIAGIYDPRILITLQPPPTAVPLTTQVMIRPSGSGAYLPAITDYAQTTAIAIGDIAAGNLYDIHIKYVSSTGMISLPLAINTYLAEGLEGLPSTVGDFSLSCLGDTAHLGWSRVPDVDLDHYVLRFSPRTIGASWENASDLILSIPAAATSVSVPAMSGSYLIKAVDQGGRTSADSAMIVSTTPSLTGFNAILTAEESPGFAGTHTGTANNGSGLQLAGRDSIDDWNDIDAVESTDIGDDGLVTAGDYLFAAPVDLGGIYVSRVTVDLQVSGLDMTGSIDRFSNIDTVENWDQTSDPANWSASLWIATTDDDPADDDAIWTPWSAFVIGDIRARGYRFRMKLSSENANITPLVQQVRIMIDMPDRLASGSDIPTLPGGSDIAFDTPFRTVPAVSITARSMATGDYWQISDVTTAGFRVRFLDSAGNGVERAFDYVAKGAGAAA